ncbi:hypothetical protein [Streptomyces sp. NPDC052179]|uniref:hypothetical protein n=1 Tax=Streptomyces sp. NPDC052179 TaxID=3155680 RepID=UPI00344AD6AE
MTDLTKQREAMRANGSPRSKQIDLESISKLSGEVLKLQLPTSTRSEITAQAEAIHDALNLLVREELGADQSPMVRDLIRRAYRLLSAQEPPVTQMPPFSAFAHIRETASITRRLLWIWAERNNAERP